MKYVLLIIDGVSDEPIKELDGCTPLEKSFIPNIQYMATKGQIGRIDTAFYEYPVESMVCIMGLLGYDPRKYYPCGRASFEAMAQGINIGENDLVFRCNIITTNDKKEKIEDFTANLISDTEARKFIGKLQIPKENWEIHPGQSYRNILVIRNSPLKADEIECFPPHMHIGENISELSLISKNSNDENFTQDLMKFILSTNTDNNNRMLWLWSPSKATNWPSFKEITGLNGAVVCGMDFLRGIAMAADMHFDVIPGTTGYIDTDYSAKAHYAIKYLEKNDFVLVHINATDEEAHQHNYNGKIKAIEKVDKLVLGPILQELNEKYKDNYRIAICGDHMTRCSDGKHIGEPVPVAIFGKEIVNKKNEVFNEKNCKKYDEIKSLEFISKHFIKNK